MATRLQTANRLRTALAERAESGPSYGAWQMFRGANLARTLARSGVDWVLVDCEHGDIDDAEMHAAVPAIAAAGASPVVRIPGLSSWMIKRALDTGAHGILVPMLRTVEEAEALVQAAKFPPQGRRGYGSPFAMERFAGGPGRAADVVPSSAEYLDTANDGLLTMVQIETREALDDVERIAAVDGIDVLFVGPFDLGNSIGYPIRENGAPPELMAAIMSILQATRSAGKKCGVYATNGAQARMYAEKGFDMISIGLDVSMLEAVAAREVAEARGGGKPQGKGGY